MFERTEWDDAFLRGGGPSAEVVLARTFAELWASNGAGLANEQASSLFQLSPVALVEVDASGRVELANPSAQRLLEIAATGVLVSELEQDTLVSERILQVARAARLHGRAVAGLELHGRSYQVEGRAGTGADRALLSFIDAEHVMADGEMSRSARALRAMLRAAREGVALLAEQQVLYANAAWYKLTGPSTESSFLSEVVEGKSLATRLSELAAADSDQTIDVRLGEGTSNEVMAELTSAFVEYQGRPCVLVMARDLTARRRLEARVARSERLASLGMLVAGVAHEINNPLTYALGNLESLAARMESSTEAFSQDDAREAVRDAIDGCRRIATIIRELRSFHRADDNEIVLVDPNQVVRDAVRIVGPKCAAIARLEMDLAEVPPVLGVATSLVQVLINLIVNAVDAMSERGPESNLIRISTGSRGTDVRIEVSDNGRGIAAADLSRIFEPFFSRGKTGGTGLGLTISRNLIEQLNGWIDVDSRPGAGTRFIVHLEAARAREATQTSEPPMPPPTLLSELRVLVVDDEPLVARSVARLLAQAQEVVCAHSVAGALDILSARDDIDVVVSDWVMPDGGAQSLMRHLDYRGQGRVPLVVMTGLGQLGGREPVEGPCVRKPVSRTALLNGIAHALGLFGRNSMVVRTDTVRRAEYSLIAPPDSVSQRGRR
ncbi:MAG TPA: ATP-binding protein [Polyangiaceae bacterium]|nr:ATP-binding protein [Polyangiaceae bacterium]